MASDDGEGSRPLSLSGISLYTIVCGLSAPSLFTVIKKRDTRKSFHTHLEALGIVGSRNRFNWFDVREGLLKGDIATISIDIMQREEKSDHISDTRKGLSGESSTIGCKKAAELF